jgi:3',5'-cyclic AMP phosphodiesterase CpdA
VLLGDLAWGVDENASGFTFVHMSDSHIGHHDEAVDSFRCAIQGVNALRPRPRFILMTGDLGESRLSDYRGFRRIAAESTIPVHALPGNHDVGNRLSEDSQRLLDRYRAEIGPDYHAFVVGPPEEHAHFILLNSLFLRTRSGIFNRSVRRRFDDEVEAQWEFLERELEKSVAGPRPARSVFLAFHHLPYAVHPKGPAGGYLPISRAARKRIFALCAKYDVQAILSGHAHWSRAQDYEGTALITTPSVSYNSPVGFNGRVPLGFRVINVGSEGISHRYKSLDFAGMEVPRHLGIKQVESDGSYVASLDGETSNPRTMSLAV